MELKNKYIIAGLLFFTLMINTAVADLYGSISTCRTTGKSGVSWGWSSADKAISVAYGYCVKKGGLPSCCTSDSYLKNECGAVAIGDNNIFGEGVGSTERNAIKDALKKCQEETVSCKLEKSFCSWD